MISSTDLGNIIKDLRLKAGISQGELGRSLGKSHAAVSDIERGKTELSVTDLQKIAAVFGVALATFLEVPPPSQYMNFRHDKNVTPEQVKKSLGDAEDFRAYIRQLHKEKMEKSNG